MKIYKIIALLCALPLFIHAQWENGMLRHFEFVSETEVNEDFPYGDGSSPTWATLAEFEFETASPGDDSGVILFQAGLLTDGISEVVGAFALSIDDVIVGTTSTGMTTTDSWGIGKFRIHQSIGSAPETGWSVLFNMQWPILPALLSAGTHSVKLLAAWTVSDFPELGFNISGGASMAFVGFPESDITQVTP